jgi:hypothetical protein
VPRTRLAHAQFRDKDVHLGIELDQDAFRVVVIRGQIVACRVARRSPKDWRSGMVELVARRRVSRAVF